MSSGTTAPTPAADPPTPSATRDTPAASRGSRRLLLVSSGTTLAAGMTVVTGLGLDVSIAASFGAGRATDAFFVAQRVPVGVGTVVLGGINLALVPVIATWIATLGQERASRHVSAVLGAVTAVCLALSLPFALLAPIFTRITAPGLPGTESSLASSMLLVMLLVMPLTGIAEVMRAALNARNRFVQPALLNSALNLGAMVVILGWHSHGIRIAAWAYVVGAAARVLLGMPMMHRAGYRFSIRAALGIRKDREAWKAVRLSANPATAATFAPIMRLIEQAFTSFLPAGSITLLNYGYRLVFASSGTVFFRSIVGILVPRLTDATARNQTARVRRIVVQGFRAMTAVSVGLTTMLATLAVPIALVLFRRGNMTHESAVLLGELIAVLSLSLVGEAWQRMLLAPLYAGLDTRTPLHNAILGAAAELVLLPPLVLPFGGRQTAMFGIAVAFVLSEYVGPVHAYIKLRSRIGAIRFDWRSIIAPVSLATAVAAGVAVSAYIGLGLGGPHPRVLWLVLVSVSVLAVGGVYALVIVLFARRPSFGFGLAAGGNT